MSATAVGWVCGPDWDMVRPPVRHVAMCLAHHLNEINGECYPSATTVARETGHPERVVRRLFAELREVGRLGTRFVPGKSTFWVFPSVASMRQTPDSQSPCQTVTPDSQYRGPLTLSTTTPDSQSPKQEKTGIEQEDQRLRKSKPRTPRRMHPLPATRPNSERLLAIIVRGLGDAWGSEPVVNGKREKVLTQLDDLLTAKDFDEVEALYADKLVDAASDPYRRAALRDVVTVASVDGYNALLAVKPKAGRPWQPGDELPHWTDEFPDMALRAMPQAEHDRREREWQERKRNR